MSTDRLTASEDDLAKMHDDILFGTATNLGAGPWPPSLIDVRRRWCRDTNKNSNPSGSGFRPGRRVFASRRA